MSDETKSWFSRFLEKSGFSKLADFSHKHTFAGKAKMVVLVWGAQLIWTCAMLFFVKYFLLSGKTFQEILNVAFGTPFIGAKFITSVLDLPLYTTADAFIFFAIPTFLTFFLLCILAPLWEEIAFRYFPIKWAQRQEGMLLPTVLLSSIVFGVMHGSAINILFQGVSGLLLCYLYLKCNNSYWSAVAGHAMWNFSLAFLLPILFVR